MNMQFVNKSLQILIIISTHVIEFPAVGFDIVGLDTTYKLEKHVLLKFRHLV
jgi:hypothetical protein